MHMQTHRSISNSASRNTVGAVGTTSIPLEFLPPITFFEFANGILNEDDDTGTVECEESKKDAATAIDIDYPIVLCG